MKIKNAALFIFINQGNLQFCPLFILKVFIVDNIYCFSQINSSFDFVNKEISGNIL